MRRTGRAFGILLVLDLVALALAITMRLARDRGLITQAFPGAYLADALDIFLGAAILTGLLLLAVRLIEHRLHREAGHQGHQGLLALETTAAILLGILVVVAAAGDLGDAALSAGLVGVALTFALQRPILAVAGWAYVRFGRLFKEGDRIEVDAVVGDVIEITLFKTKIWEIGMVESDLPWGGKIAPLRSTGRIVTLSNAMFLENPVANATADTPYLFDEFAVRVPYEADWRFARDMLREVAGKVIQADVHAAAAREYEAATADLPIRGLFPREPSILVSLEDHWIELRLRYLTDIRMRSEVRTALATGWEERRALHPGRVPVAYLRRQNIALAPADVAPRARRARPRGARSRRPIRSDTSAVARRGDDEEAADY